MPAGVKSRYLQPTALVKHLRGARHSTVDKNPDAMLALFDRVVTMRAVVPIWVFAETPFSGLPLNECVAAFVFGVSKLDVMFGRKMPADVRHPYRNIVKPGVRFLTSTVRSIGRTARGDRRWNV